MNRIALTSLSALCTRVLAPVLLAASLLSAQGSHTPTLPPGTEALQVPAGNTVSLHVYAAGFQTYWWDATRNVWQFTGPRAVLYADAAWTAKIGEHANGPVWVSNSGSGVVGQVVAASTVATDSIPWLLLKTVSTRGPGIFAPTTFVQRVNTSGGLPPARTGQLNEVVWVPYTAEYYFYRAK